MLTRAMYEFLKSKQSKPYEMKTIKYRGHALRIEVADSFVRQTVGLSFRDKMGKSDGMLFPLKFEGINTAAITMMDMKFSIDIVWLDKNGYVVDVIERAPPTASIFSRPYAPKAKAKYVLELNAGTASRLGIREKEKIRIG